MDWAATFHWLNTYGAIIFYGSLTVSVVALSFYTRSPDVRRASVFLATMWLFYNFVQPQFSAYEISQMFSWLDTLGLALGFTFLGRVTRKNGKQRWVAGRRLWTIAFSGFFFVQICAHLWVAFDPSLKTFYYFLVLNILYVGELASVATPSLAYVFKKRRQRANASSTSASPFARYEL